MKRKREGPNNAYCGKKEFLLYVVVVVCSMDTQNNWIR